MVWFTLELPLYQHTTVIYYYYKYSSLRLPVEVICTKVELEGDRLEENKQKRLFTNCKHAK